MATNLVQIVGDSSNLRIAATNLTGVAELEFVSGSFRSSPEERRVCSVFLTTAGGFIELRLEFTDRAFAEMDIVGKSQSTENRY